MQLFLIKYQPCQPLNDARHLKKAITLLEKTNKVNKKTGPEKSP
jgi:hypothetical protein